MSVDVRQQLDRLAQDAPTGVPPSDLWQRGVRRRRRRLAGAVAASVLAVLAGGAFAGAVVTFAPDLSPAATDDAAIPSRIEQPDPRTSGTDRKGAPGTLAVVAGASRLTGFLGTSSDGLVGISAAGGSYRFLDLPGRLPDSAGLLSSDEPVALSPDGRRVAYWLGDTTASGVAIYDTVTGDLRSASFASPKGLAPETLSWVSDDELRVRYGVITQLASDSISSTLGPEVLLDASTGRRVELAVPRRASVDRTAPMPGGFSSWDGRTLGLWARSGATYAPRLVQVRGLDPDDGLGTLVVGPARGLAAVVSVPSAGTSRLYVAEVPTRASSTRVHRVETSVDVQTVVGWRDPTHVMVEGAVGRARGVFAVDVTSGASEPAVRVPMLSYTPGQVYAGDLWSRPTVDRPAPRDVPDPRLAFLVGGGIALAALASILVRRRRGPA